MIEFDAYNLSELKAKLTAAMPSFRAKRGREPSEALDYCRIDCVARHGKIRRGQLWEIGATTDGRGPTATLFLR
ncbi:hypothetical protein DRN94_004530 [archaeon]|nr:hypothetical protein [archaeon]